MPYTLDEMARDCRDALVADAGPDGREQVRQIVQRALTDKDFVAPHLGDDADQERTILYEDPDLGFCICAHVYDGPRQGKPHDHGPTWAIYGQAVGETEMTDWRMVSPPAGDTPGKVEMTRTYKLTPGDAHVYQVGDVHAPMRDGPTRLLRIEGINTDHVERTKVEPIG